MRRIVFGYTMAVSFGVSAAIAPNWYWFGFAITAAVFIAVFTTGHLIDRMDHNTMGSQRLGAKAIRRIERDIGEPVLRGWAHGGYWFDFVTPDHRHGYWNKTSREWRWHDDALDGRLIHYNTCDQTWPQVTEGTHHE
jgi:hypothetical protein